MNVVQQCKAGRDGTPVAVYRTAASRGQAASAHSATLLLLHTHMYMYAGMPVSTQGEQRRQHLPVKPTFCNI